MDIFEIGSTVEMTIQEVALKEKGAGFSKIVLAGGQHVFNISSGMMVPTIKMEITTASPSEVLDILDAFDRVPGERIEVLFRKIEDE